MSPRMGLDLPTVLQAAAELADEQGLDSVTLLALAKQLNVRSPSLYNHVNGLPELRVQLAVHGLQLLKERLSPASSEISPETRVRLVGEAYVAFAREHPGLYQATLRAPNAQHPAYHEAAKELSDVVFQCLREFNLEGDALIHAVRGLRSVLHGFASLEQAGGFGLPVMLDLSLRETIDTFLAGLHARRKA